MKVAETTLCCSMTHKNEPSTLSRFFTCTVAPTNALFLKSKFAKEAELASERRWHRCAISQTGPIRRWHFLYLVCRHNLGVGEQFNQSKCLLFVFACFVWLMRSWRERPVCVCGQRQWRVVFEAVLRHLLQHVFVYCLFVWFLVLTVAIKGTFHCQKKKKKISLCSMPCLF